MEELLSNLLLPDPDPAEAGGDVGGDWAAAQRDVAAYLQAVAESGAGCKAELYSR